jgi:hypothetical protein
MATKRPSDYVNSAALCVNVALNWRTRFSTYEVKFANFTDFETEANAFKAKALVNASQDSTNSNAVALLKTTNKTINESVKVLRKYIVAEYPLLKNVNTHLLNYGLETNSRGTYEIPSDNDRRVQRITILVNKMSEPNNPFAQKDFGLTHWQQLQTDQKTAWETSLEGKGDKTTHSRETKAYFDTLNEVLRKLSLQIKIDFPKADHKKIMREFGFLNETYK